MPKMTLYVKQISLMKEGSPGLTKVCLMAALQQNKKVSQLPSEEQLWNMNEIEIETCQELIEDALTQYENHTKRDHANLRLLREQGSLLANLAWEQQMHICDLNDRYLRLVEERKRIVEESDAPIFDSVDTNDEGLKTLQDTLNQRHTKMSNILTSVNINLIMTTISKLTSASSELTTRNAQLVMRNNKLTHELSFMPPAMRQRIV
jgi:hypothetical protein